jgi:pyruvate/2-oxoglutarate dehydrogenase complex dihydrolipoamide dehydrogenase (E3) component
MTNRQGQFDYDVAVIGAGSGGFAAARTAVSHGLRCVLLEGAEEVGGLCILRGCMPTKALLYASEVRHLARKGPLWGVHPDSVGFQWNEVMARKDAVIKEFAAYRREQLSNARFEFVRASAAFTDAHTLKLSTGKRISASQFIIATGSKVADPPLPELRRLGYLTSDDALRLATPPESLIVLGGGPIALEFAQFFSRFDTQVTVIQRSPQVLRDFDVDCARALQGAFAQEGLTVHTGTKLLVAGQDGRQKVIEFEQDGDRHSCRAHEILFALGRTPDTANLGLETAGVRTKDHRIVTDATQQTSVPHIFAAGDCCGPYEIVHIAIQQGETAAHNIAHPQSPRSMDYRLLINVVFTDPNVATVGLTEKQAQADGVEYRAAKYPFNDHGKSIIMDAMHGEVKLLADPASGEILGGSCVGPAGAELIHEIAAAMHKRMTVQELAAMPHYHPTLAEIWTYPAEELAEQIRA